MSDDLYYDRQLKKYRTIDAETGELGRVVRGSPPYFIVNVEPYKRLGEIIGMHTLGFFSILVGHITYKNRVYVSYRQIEQRYGISSATIKRHMDVLKENNILLEGGGTNGTRKYYLLNGEYVFRGKRTQREENKKIFQENMEVLRGEK